MSQYERMDRDTASTPLGAEAIGAGRGAAGENERSPEEIERDIELTRQRMSEGIDAIGNKLHPSNLAAQAQEAITGAAQNAVGEMGDRVRRGGSGFVGMLRENPLPAIAVGASLAWLVSSARGSSSEPRREWEGRGEWEGRRGFTDYGYGRGGYRGRERLGESEHEAGLRARVSHAASDVAEKAHDLTDRAGDVAERTKERAKERASELGSSVRDRMHELRSQARHQTDRARDRLDRTRAENPLALAAGAAVLGTVLGMLVPRTRRENELMGRVRDQVVDRAQDAARVVKDATAETASDVKGTVQQELSDKAPELKSAAKDVKDRVKEQVSDNASRAAREVKQEVKQSTKRGGSGGTQTT